MLHELWLAGYVTEGLEEIPERRICHFNSKQSLMKFVRENMRFDSWSHAAEYTVKIYHDFEGDDLYVSRSLDTMLNP